MKLLLDYLSRVDEVAAIHGSACMFVYIHVFNYQDVANSSRRKGLGPERPKNRYIQGD